MHRGADGQGLQGGRQAAIRGQKFRLPGRTAQELHTPRLQVIDAALDFQATWIWMQKGANVNTESEQIITNQQIRSCFNKLEHE